MLRYLQAMIESFYSKDLYKEVAQQWKGIAGFYLLLAVILCWLPGIYNLYGFQNSLNTVFNDNSDYRGMITQLPSMNVMNGVLTIDVPTPYAVRDPKSNEPLLVFDTKNELPSMSGFPHGVVITDTLIKVKSKDGVIKTYALSPDHNFSFDAKTLTRFYDLRWLWFGVVILPVLVIITWVGRMVLAVCLAIFALMFAAIAKANLTFRQCIPLTVVAMTPALILSTVLEVFNFQHPVLMAAYVVLTLFYLGFAVFANRGVSVSEGMSI